MLSPGIYITEEDRQEYVQNVVGSEGAFVGIFHWGPADEPVLVSTERQLVETFGIPNDLNAQHFFSANDFLTYSNALYTVRGTYPNTNPFETSGQSYSSTGAYNATSGSSMVLIKNDAHYEQIVSDLPGSVGPWVAKYPGTIGNSLKVVVCDGLASANQYQSSSFYSGTSLKFSDLFDRPGTSPYAIVKGKTSAVDEVHVLVIDEDGLITGTANTVLESFPFLSKASDAKGTDGSTIYYKDLINKTSKWIWFGNKITAGTNWNTTVTVTSTFTVLSAPVANSLALGQDLSTDHYDAAVNAGWTQFSDNEDIQFSVAISGSNPSNVATEILSIVESRRDCVAVFSPSLDCFLATSADDILDNVLGYFNTTFNVNSTYAVLDANWKYRYDKFNDVYRWTPCNPDVAGCIARVDATNDQWWSPAGMQRGVLKNVIKLAWNPNKAQRDQLYLNRINPIISKPGYGQLLFGDKTATRRPGAFDNIGVRRLFILLERNISDYAQTGLFEFNDKFTQTRFRVQVENYLETIKAGRGVLEYKVVCDSTNNTTQVVNARQFIGDIYIRPNRAINFIRLNFIAVNSVVDFQISA